ncbi:hypothetical protein F5Y05DRAFT_421578 [Hypoxylon sp. FL0543]|nr:hypothetical protein F5Y05DRAFT_421578 [Hypoxylon sp. FL0543]
MCPSTKSDAVTSEQAKTPVMANLSDILGRQIVFEEQPQHIQEKLSEISVVEDKLVQLFEKAKVCNSALDAGLTFDYLHLFKEYQVLVREIETELRAQDTEETADSQAEQWAKVLYKSAMRMRIAASRLQDMARNVITYEDNWMIRNIPLDQVEERQRKLQSKMNRDHYRQMHREINRMVTLIGMISDPINDVYAEVKRIRPSEDDLSLSDVIWDETFDWTDDNVDSISEYSSVESPWESESAVSDTEI